MGPSNQRSTCSLSIWYVVSRVSTDAVERQVVSSKQFSFTVLTFWGQDVRWAHCSTFQRSIWTCIR